MPKPEEFASHAWMLKGLTQSIPGWMAIKDERVCFATPDGVVFDVARSEITAVVFPWYYFGGGVKLEAAGVPYRISFVKPNGAEYAVARGLAAVGSTASLAFVASKIGDMRDGRDVGKRWREILAGAASA